MENGENEQPQPSDATIIEFGERDTNVGTPEERPKARDAIGDVLREERTAQRRTLADVADEASVSLPYLSEIERGRKEVSSDLLESVCDALQVEVGDVLERAGRRLRTETTAVRSAFCLAA